MVGMIEELPNLYLPWQKCRKKSHPAKQGGSLKKIGLLFSFLFFNQFFHISISCFDNVNTTAQSRYIDLGLAFV